MKMNKAALALAIASSFGAMSGAQAAINLSADSDKNTPLKVANEISLQNVGPFLNDDTGGPAQNNLVVLLPALNGYITNANNRYFVKVALLDGATFNGTAQLTCNAVVAPATVAADVVLERPQNGTKGESIATFSLATDSKLTDDTCTLQVVGGDNSVVGMTGYYDITDKVDQRMSAVIEYQDGLTNKSTSTVATFIDFVTALTVSASTKSVNGTDAKAVISVQDASLKFTDDTRPSTTNAFVGSVSYGKDAKLDGAKVYGPQTAAEVGPDLILESASITVTSPALAGIDAVSLSNAGLCGNTSGGTVSPNGSTSVTFNGITPALLAAGLDICIAADSVTNIPAGQFTVTVSGTGNKDMEPNFGAADRLIFNLEKNGSSYRALNIPPAGVADKAFIRLYNVSNFAGTVLGTMRDATGALIGTQGTVVTTLGPREVKVVNAETLKTLFGDWTGRSRLFLEADIDQLRVQSLLRSSDVLENMSSQAED